MIPLNFSPRMSPAYSATQGVLMLEDTKDHDLLGQVVYSNNI